MEVEKAYLSPTQLMYLAQGQQEIRYNAIKQDVFTLGLTLMECATLSSSSLLYDWESMSLKQEELKQNLDLATTRYSAEFIAIVNLMLQFEELYRPDFKQLQLHIKNEFEQLQQASKDVVIEGESNLRVPSNNQSLQNHIQKQEDEAKLEVISNSSRKQQLVNGLDQQADSQRYSSVRGSSQGRRQNIFPDKNQSSQLRQSSNVILYPTPSADQPKQAEQNLINSVQHPTFADQINEQSMSKRSSRHVLLNEPIRQKQSQQQQVEGVQNQQKDIQESRALLQTPIIQQFQPHLIEQQANPVFKQPQQIAASVASNKPQKSQQSQVQPVLPQVPLPVQTQQSSIQNLGIQQKPNNLIPNQPQKPQAIKQNNIPSQQTPQVTTQVPQNLAPQQGRSPPTTTSIPVKASNGQIIYIVQPTTAPQKQVVYQNQRLVEMGSVPSSPVIRNSPFADVNHSHRLGVTIQNPNLANIVNQHQPSLVSYRPGIQYVPNGTSIVQPNNIPSNVNKIQYVNQQNQLSTQGTPFSNGGVKAPASHLMGSPPPAALFHPSLIQSPVQTFQQNKSVNQFESHEVQTTSKKTVRFSSISDAGSKENQTRNSQIMSSGIGGMSSQKRSQLDFNNDLDRRVAEALEMTKQTMKKNQSVPNIRDSNLHEHY